MFFHFSIMMIISKKKGKKFDQNLYDELFRNIENDLRELGYGDVAVNKKMKDLNKILYDILLKSESKTLDQDRFVLNEKLIIKYFDVIKVDNEEKLEEFTGYFNKFYHFCFELSPDNMVREAIKFNY